MTHVCKTFSTFIQKACAEQADILIKPKFKKLKQTSDHPICLVLNHQH